jgi:uncharacterized integral membrane protein
MSTLPALEEQIATAGIAYGKRHVVSYRVGLVMQVLGAGAVAVLYPLSSPFYSAGIMLFELGVLLSSIYLLVWISWIKKIIVGAVVAGIALQFAGYHAPEEYAGSVIIAGIGLVCVGGAGLVGKEAYCFAYREGWVLTGVYPLLVLANLIGRENVVLNTISFSAIFLLLVSLTGKNSNSRCSRRA